MPSDAHPHSFAGLGFGPTCGSTNEWAFSPELITCDRTAVHCVGPVDDAQRAGPRVEVGQWCVVTDTGATEHLDRPVNDSSRHGRRGDLDRRDLGTRALGSVLVNEPRSL